MKYVCGPMGPVEYGGSDAPEVVSFVAQVSVVASKRTMYMS